MTNGFHHLHVRKRIYKNLEKYPHSNAFKRALDYVMYCIVGLTPLVLLPQVYHLFAYHSAAGLSLITWTSLTGINALWALYGLVHRERPIVIGNILVGILDMTIVYGILLYR